LTKQTADCKEIARKIRVAIKNFPMCKDCKKMDKCSQELRIALTTTNFAFSDQVKEVLKQVQEKIDGNPVGSETKKMV